MTGKELARRWFDEVWNRRDASAIGRMFAQNGVSHGLGANGQDLIGPAGFLPFHQAFLGGFSDLRITLDDVIEEGDRVAIRWHATGTLTGHGMGFAPTGKPMTVTGMSMVRVAQDQIVESWNNFDVLGMHQQLGTLAMVAGV